MYKDNPLLEKSLKFAARIVKLYQYLSNEKKESIISKQINNNRALLIVNCQSSLPAANTAITIIPISIPRAIKHT